MTKPSILTTLSDEKIQAELPLMSREAADWLRLKVRELTNPPKLAYGIYKEKPRFTRMNDYRRFLIGGMYFFLYDPKTKEELPYYDRFPLVIPLKREDDGFLGLNLHYLPVPYRIRLLRKLLPLAMYDGDDIRKTIHKNKQHLFKFIYCSNVTFKFKCCSTRLQSRSHGSAPDVSFRN